MARVLDWPERLVAAIEDARHRPYVLGEHDCLRFSCACIAAMTGTDYWPRFAGYKSKREALVTIARIAPSLGEAVELVLEQPRRPAAFAQRGDLVLYSDAGGDHLGICIGRDVAVLMDSGLTFVRLTHPGVGGSWRIG